MIIFLDCKDTIFLVSYEKNLNIFSYRSVCIVLSSCRVAGRQSRKMAKPILRRGLAVCERSEHGKSQLFIKYLCTILITFLSFIFSNTLFSQILFFSNLSNYTELSTLFNLIFSLPNCTALPQNDR